MLRVACGVRGVGAFDNDTNVRTAMDGPQVTTDALAESNLRWRNYVCSAIISVSGALVTGLAVASVYRKKKRLALGPLVYEKSRGLLFRDKRVCGARMSGYETVSSPDQELRVQGEALAQGGAAQDQVGQEVPGEVDEEVDEGHADDFLQKLLERDIQDRETNYPKLLKGRRVLLSVIFFAYVSASVGIPLLKRSTVSCEQGFFWEDHMPFLFLFVFTKLVEISIYTFDPTIHVELDLVDFMMKFVPSFFGFVDGYTDSSSIVIASACEDSFAQSLSVFMGITYIIGVVLGQWVLVAALTYGDPTQACLLKLIHMDMLAACINLPEEQKWIWTTVNLVRTFAEDLPQAAAQTLFLIYVKQNYFMVVSVAVSMLASGKALYDAMHRLSAAAGAQLDFEVVGHGTRASIEAIEFAEGVEQYSDRSYKLTGVPDFLLGSTFFQGPCHCKTGEKITIDPQSQPGPTTLFILIYDGNEAPEKEAIRGLLDGWDYQDTAIRTGSFNTAGCRVYKKLLQGSETITLNTHIELSIALSTRTGTPKVYVYPAPKSYIQVKFEEGVTVYTDRGYILTDVPDFLRDTTLFQGPCHHHSGDVITIRSQTRVTIYVLVYDGNEASEKEAIHRVLSDWATDQISDTTLRTQSFNRIGCRVYQKVVSSTVRLRVNTHIELSIAVAKMEGS